MVKIITLRRCGGSVGTNLPKEIFDHGPQDWRGTVGVAPEPEDHGMFQVTGEAVDQAATGPLLRQAEQGRSRSKAGAGGSRST